MRNVSIGGVVRYYASGIPVPDSLLELPGGVSARTGDNGRFSLSAPADGAASVELSAEKRGDLGAAVSSLDAVYILQHVVGRRSLSERERLACDVTGDGLVSALDAARVLEIAVGSIRRVPILESCDSDWLFVVGNGEQAARTASCHPLAIPLESTTSLEIEALLPGDCTGNWEPQASASRQLIEVGRNAPQVRVGRTQVRGSRVLVPIYVRADDPYQAMDVEIAFDAGDVTPVRVRMLGRRRGGLLKMNSQPDGRLSVAAAHPESINGRHRRQVMLLEFEMVSEGPVAATPSIELGDLRIDERAAQVR